MSELQTKINTAIERLKAFEPVDEPPTNTSGWEVW